MKKSELRTLATAFLKRFFVPPPGREVQPIVVAKASPLSMVAKEMSFVSEKVPQPDRHMAFCDVGQDEPLLILPVGIAAAGIARGRMAEQLLQFTGAPPLLEFSPEEVSAAIKYVVAQACLAKLSPFTVEQIVPRADGGMGVALRLDAARLAELNQQADQPTVLTVEKPSDSRLN